MVDWNNRGVWGGNGNWGNDVNIDCNHCFNNNNFNGKININDVDWKNVDRSKINFDKNQFNKIDRTNIKNSIKTNKQQHQEQSGRSEEEPALDFAREQGRSGSRRPQEHA